MMISGALEFMDEWGTSPNFNPYDDDHPITTTRKNSTDNDNNHNGSNSSSSSYDEVGVDNDDVDDDDDDDYYTKGGAFWDDDMKERERLINEKDEKEKRAVNVSRTLVLLALCTVAFILGHLIYFFVKNTEQDEFADKFFSNSEEFFNVASLKMQELSESLHTFSMLYSSSSSSDNDGEGPPYKTLMDFERFAQNLLIQSHSTSDIMIWLAYTPFLKNDIMKLKWENYSITHQVEWFPTTTTTTTSATSEVIWHHDYADYVNAMTNDTETTLLVEQETQATSYTPLWQMSPLPILEPSIINYDMEYDMAFLGAKNQMVHHSKTTVWSSPLGEEWNVSSPFPFLVPPMPTTSSNATNSSISTTTESASAMLSAPHSWVLHPIIQESSLSSSQEDTIVGTILAMISWETLWESSLNSDMEGMLIVMKHCDTSFSFLVTGPKDVQFLGLGLDEYHDEEFDGMEFASVLWEDPSSSSQSNEEVVTATPGLSDDDKPVCDNYDILLYLYPTMVMKKEFISSNPAKYALLISALFGISIVLFVFYDGNITRRQQKVEEKAKQTDAIVTQLFPGQLRDLVIESDPSTTCNTTEDCTNEGGTGMTVKKQRKDEHTTQGIFEGSKSMADFFPECTVMMADLVGFLSWSSTHEPGQVFELLETIFQGFDKIARRRGVFKVETIGDVYVAVSGVPQARKDHAIAMARYANNCLQEFQKTLAVLERKFGPDTAELALRVGLHSGAVTAGILRGDRARFQLFGETMTTTSRVQGLCDKNRIHISEQTAELLSTSGKRHWLEKRFSTSDLKTFCLNIRVRGGAGSVASSGARSSLGDISEQGSHDAGSHDDESQDGGDRDDEDRTKYPEEPIRMEGMPKLDPLKIKLVDWNFEQLLRLLKQIVAKRQVKQRQPPSRTENLNDMAQGMGHGTIPAEEVVEIIKLPAFDRKTVGTLDIDSVQLSREVMGQLRKYISIIASLYLPNPFHSFRHASHVAMSMMKLLSRIVAPKMNTTDSSSGDSENDNSETLQVDAMLHDHTYGITSDPITQFAVVLSALIHDVDHRGIANNILAQEHPELGAKYKHKSVAEQNSVDLAWDLLMQDEYKDLRECIFIDMHELVRFRQLIVNSVIATDIFDKEQGAIRKNRWAKAFADNGSKAEAAEDVNRKATIVIEHLIQASDVAHTMQHWEVYQTWNLRLFQEMRKAHLAGHVDKCPSLGWYKGELWFFDNYIIPLAKKLDTCGAFGVSTDEFLSYATVNRSRWLSQGADIVAKWLAQEKEEEEKERQVPQLKQHRQSSEDETSAVFSV